MGNVKLEPPLGMLVAETEVEPVVVGVDLAWGEDKNTVPCQP